MKDVPKTTQRSRRPAQKSNTMPKKRTASSTVQRKKSREKQERVGEVDRLPAILKRIVPHLSEYRLWTFDYKRGTGLTGLVQAIRAQKSVDGFFLCMVLVLLAAGLVMMFSAGYVDAQEHLGNAYAYIKPQATYALLGLVIMAVVSNVNPKVFRGFAYIAVAVSFVLLVVVLVYHTNLGAGREDIARYIPIFGGTFQPSEIAKLGLILFCAASMEARRAEIYGNTGRVKKRVSWWRGLLAIAPYVVVVGGMSGLVFLEHHLSGTILIAFLGMVMMWLGGVKWYWFMIPIGAVAAFYLLYKAGFSPVVKIFQSYMLERVKAWQDKSYDPLGARWQVNQSLYAIGSGGFWGSGFGQSKQKHLYVSEPHNDFIFSILCEEFGYIGAIITMLLFALLVKQGFTIASRQNSSDKRFNSLLCMGICFQVGMQAALNIAVVTDTIPNTGIGLPFFSYGGTSLVILLAEMGMVLSCSRTTRRRG
ncbi:MAG: FtsW/RodA/SpoVE family cell cycle protein [Oscillospiraceae bacterium]|jgi:cell division protein FtsW|nr:FtsW/RodA/SpoVE family cell cycle protein [Oscillospiraceae bacterium]